MPSLNISPPRITHCSLIPEPSFEIIRCATFRSKEALWDTIVDDVYQQQCTDIGHSDGPFPSIESDGESSNNGEISIDMVDGGKDSITLALGSDGDTSTTGGGDDVSNNDCGEFVDDELGSHLLYPHSITYDGCSSGTNANTCNDTDIIVNSAPMLDERITHDGASGISLGSVSSVPDDTVPISNVGDDIPIKGIDAKALTVVTTDGVDNSAPISGGTLVHCSTDEMLSGNDGGASNVFVPISNEGAVLNGPDGRLTEPI